MRAFGRSSSDSGGARLGAEERDRGQCERQLNRAEQRQRGAKPQPKRLVEEERFARRMSKGRPAMLRGLAAARPSRRNGEGFIYPNLIEIGGFTVTSFGAMSFLAFVAGAWVTGIQLERRNLKAEHIWEILPWVALGGIVGAKLYYVALQWQDPVGALFSRGWLVWYGGFIGGALAYVWQLRRRELPMARMFDAIAPGLALSYALGRIGCFLVGDDYGLPTDSWVGVAFPNGADARRRRSRRPLDRCPLGGGVYAASQ
jgi:hypothetical protein